jgi:hypothetical protein
MCHASGQLSPFVTINSRVCAESNIVEIWLTSFSHFSFKALKESYEGNLLTLLSTLKVILCENFLISKMSRLAVGPLQPPIWLALRTHSSGVKWPGPEADHLPPSNAEAKNE